MIRPVFKCHGGKFHLRHFLLNHLPKNYTKYVEGFGGACSLLLNKPQSEYEIYNDLDPGIVSIIRELQNPEFIKEVQNTEYNESVFNWSKTTNTPLAELVRRRFSRGGLQKAFSWSERTRGGLPGEVNAWNTYKKEIIRIADRLKNVKIYNLPAIELINQLDNEEVFFFFDPPYLPSCRQSPNVYVFEMTEQDHIDLAESLNAIKGKVLLSGYQSQLYAKLYKNWNMGCISIVNHSSQAKTKQKRIEVVWYNY